MIWNWYDSKALGMKLLQVPHDLPRWVVYSSPYTGHGLVQVVEGTSQNPPLLLVEILKIDRVVQVIADTMDGTEYLLVSVEHHKYWDQVKSDVQQVILQVAPPRLRGDST
ncbi:MAG: hypothetical protein ACYSW8_21575 [Planctomycetota bacterium]|jgi:hypothetical protein